MHFFQYLFLLKCKLTKQNVTKTLKYDAADFEHYVKLKMLAKIAFTVSYNLVLSIEWFKNLTPQNLKLGFN